MATEAQLESELAEAKGAYRDNPDDAKAKDRLTKAKQKIIKARQERRAGIDAPTIGGDAVQSNGNEG